MARRSLPVALPTALVVFAALAGCAPQNQPAPGPPQSACTKAELKTRTPGKLTIATDEPAYAPWFADNLPANGKGFESAVAYEIAQQLGFARIDVQWVRVKFETAIAPGPKEFDFDINQFSITDERKQAVDMTSPYYLVRQAVVAGKGSKITGKTRLADLQGAKLGAQVGTTSYQAITDLIKPTVKPQVYNTNDDAKKALQNGQLDGIVVDLPTAFYITSAEIKDATIVGQLPQVGVPETFGLLLDKGSPLTGCVSGAVDALRGSGKLENLEKTWLSEVVDVPDIT
ncbi:ABC transporter substrate-binding protein [Micromonospora sp. WMMD1102]|uniref:ABC transporter substrate-binding protein n=1 Tax=Micromonospora sp. WMMD1102 TaxID=3016105 RepID=UPI002414FDE5|nr:ABC transporter substrate-binding protein [Micromonospora sp. WMMD1102]MDG4788214.1 ABC transporter substrate-binding protein [Micromonospora sp. WMMD1102]